MSVRFVAGLVLFLFSTLTVAAVTKAKDNQYVDAMAVPAGGTVYIYPIAPGASFLLDGSGRVLDELVAQLEKRKFDTTLASQPDTQEIEVTGFVDRENANKLMRLLLFTTMGQRKLTTVPSDDEYSLLVKPYLMIRMASVSRRFAKWDGVSHRMPVKGPGASSSEWRGKTRGISLILEVYSGKGEWLFTSYGGVALPDYTDLRAFENKLKDDVFDSKRNIKDGVRAALLPLGK